MEQEEGCIAERQARERWGGDIRGIMEAQIAWSEIYKTGSCRHGYVEGSSSALGDEIHLVRFGARRSRAK